MNPLEIKAIVYGVLAIVGLAILYSIIRQFTSNSSGENNYWRMNCGNVECSSRPGFDRNGNASKCC